MSDSKIEKRVISSDLRIEKRSNGRPPKIVGHAAVFNQWSEDLGGFKEKIKPGAFQNALKRSDVRALWNHDSNFVLGRMSNGTLKLKEDGKGLLMEVDPPATQMIRDMVIEPIRRGDVKEQSFGFIVGRDSWDGLDEADKNNQITRTILEIKELFDVSPVTFPAYSQTSVDLRSLYSAWDAFDYHIPRKNWSQGKYDMHNKKYYQEHPIFKKVDRVLREAQWVLDPVLWRATKLLIRHNALKATSPNFQRYSKRSQNLEWAKRYLRYRGFTNGHNYQWAKEYLKKDSYSDTMRWARQVLGR